MGVFMTNSKKTLVIVTHGVSLDEPQPTSDVRGLVAAMQAVGEIGPAREERVCLVVNEAHSAGLQTRGERGNSGPPLDIVRSRSALNECRLTAEERQFETRLLLAQRRGHDEQREIVFLDAYWSDLSRVSSFIVNLLLQIYRLIFRLGALGEDALRAAKTHTFMRNSFSFAEALTAVWIPALNLCLGAAIAGMLVASFSLSGLWMGMLWALVLMFCIGGVLYIAVLLGRERKSGLAQAQSFATLLGLVCLIVPIGLTYRCSVPEWIITSALASVDLLLGVLHFCWVLLWIATVLYALGYCWRVLLKKPSETTATGFIGLVVPPVMLAGVTMILWLVIYKLIPLTGVATMDYHRPSWMHFFPWLQPDFYPDGLTKVLPKAVADGLSVEQYFQALLSLNLDLSLFAWLVVFLTVPGILVWRLRPCIGYEGSPWNERPRQMGEEEKNKEKHRLSAAVDRAFAGAMRSVWVLGAFFVLGVPAIMYFSDWQMNPDKIVIGAGLGAILLSITQKLGSNILDRAMDVDNWLRELPADRTPRGRIMLRFWAVLRYAMDRRNGFDRVVVVSYSQGTVIWADLLRVLRWVAPDRRNGPKIQFMTFGSPLRQLHAARFPDLFAWVTQGPKVCDLWNTGSWTHAYRPGDYIGRELWGDPGTGCEQHELDPGAHCHYLSADASEVARLVSMKLG